MARLTVEDCLQHVNNRFELVLKAAKRARELERGAEPLVEWEKDKPTVVALREIAENPAALKKSEPEVEAESETNLDLEEELDLNGEINSESESKTQDHLEEMVNDVLPEIDRDEE